MELICRASYSCLEIFNKGMISFLTTRRGKCHSLGIHMYSSEQKEALKDTLYCSVSNLFWFADMPGMTIGAKCLQCWDNFLSPPSKGRVNKFGALNNRGEGSRRMMNEARSTIRCRIEDWWEVKWSLDLWAGFKALFSSPFIWHLERTDSHGGDIGFLWWGWCAESRHVLGHNAICSTPALCDATRCCSTLWCRTVVRTDFQSILIILWPGSQFILQYRRWVRAGIDLKREILFQREINYCSLSVMHNNVMMFSAFILLKIRRISKPGMIISDKNSDLLFCRAINVEYCFIKIVLYSIIHRTLMKTSVSA